MQITSKKIVELLSFPIIQSRWILILFCWGIILAQVGYAMAFAMQVYTILTHFWSMQESEILYIILTLLDMFMIVVLTRMIVVGNYHMFIEKLPSEHSEKSSSGALKVKMGSSLIGVSAINLVQTYFNPASLPLKVILIKCCIHLIFLVSAICLAYIDYLHEKSKAMEKLGERNLIHECAKLEL